MKTIVTLFRKIPKLYIPIIIILSAFSIFASCRDGCANIIPPDKLSIDYGFEAEITGWSDLGGSGERYQDSDICSSSDYASEGSNSCKITVTPESYCNGGSRAELVFDQNAYEGYETWNQWSIYIPLDYPDASLEADDGTPNWQILGQWHQQPVVCQGEDWLNFTGQGASPPVSLNYDFISSTDPVFQEITSSGIYNDVYGFDSSWDNVSVLTVSVMNKPVAFSRIEKGEWIKIKFHILWSQSDNGYVEVWKNNNLITDGKHYSCNMLNRESHYFKFGLYRNYRINNTQIIYVDDVKIW